ncbi:MAG: pantetheine-phosphate adenylyltransferase [Clostridia bacterium]|nr:pantetheine-phosphate adenylyltransferase [Clostridia bacterium]
MAKAILPGSYDPVTKGHIDIILRAKKLYGDVTVGILFNPEKEYLFTPKQKKALLEESLKDAGIPVIIWDGMLYELCVKQGYTHIVKGVRRGDMEYEEKMAQFNSARCDAVTVMLPAKEEFEFISSTLVREKLALGEDISSLCPAWELTEKLYAENTKM